jgi:hypothetical protein
MLPDAAGLPDAGPEAKCSDVQLAPVTPGARRASEDESPALGRSDVLPALAPMKPPSWAQQLAARLSLQLSWWLSWRLSWQFFWRLS